MFNIIFFDSGDIKKALTADHRASSRASHHKQFHLWSPTIGCLLTIYSLYCARQCKCRSWKRKPIADVSTKSNGCYQTIFSACLTRWVHLHVHHIILRWPITGHGVLWLVFLLRIYKLEILTLETQTHFECANSKFWIPNLKFRASKLKILNSKMRRRKTNHETPCPLGATALAYDLALSRIPLLLEAVLAYGNSYTNRAF